MSKYKNKKHSYTPIDYAHPMKPCHEPVEIIHNLYLCKESQVYDLCKEKKLDVLVPLAELDGKIWWDYDFKGEVLYFPVEDFGFLPDKVLKRCVTEIISRLKKHKVAIFCLGGHGRTGYIAACVLGALGYDDPIKMVRNKYCKSAIECNEQIESIANFINKPKLKEIYRIESKYSYGGYTWNDWIKSYSATASAKSGLKTISSFPEHLAREYYEEDCKTGWIDTPWESLSLDEKQIYYDYYAGI